MSLYLQIHLLIAITYFLFAFGRKAILRLGIRPSFRPQAVAAQIVLLSAMLAPVLIQALPQRSLPELSLRTWMPLPEAAGSSVKPVLPTQQASQEAAPALRSAPPAASLYAKLKALIIRAYMGAYTAAIMSAVARASAGAALEILSRFALLASALGFAWSALRLFGSARRIRAVLRSGIRIRRVGRVSLILTDEIAVPFSARVGRDCHAVLPCSILAHAPDFRAAVCHELQHHRQGDTLWAILNELACCLFILNPAVHLWKREITELQELSCDEALIGRERVSPRDYGSCLVRVAEAAFESRSMLAGTAGMAATRGNPAHLKSFLRRRIEMLSHYHPGARPRRGWAILLGTTGVLVTTLGAYASRTPLRSEAEAITANPGKAVFNPDLQSIAESSLKRAVKQRSAKAGFVLISDPQTGKLLAAANVSDEPGLEGKTWSLSYLMEPASAIKTIIAAQAIQSGASALDEIHDCEKNNYRFGGTLYHDWKPFDRLSTAETVIHSSNICGIKVGEKLGPQGIAQALRNFGFGPGGSTQEFPEARPGRIPEPSRFPPSKYVANLSTGYAGQYVTPLEMVQAYSAIANGGKLMKPMLAAQPDSAATVLHRVLDEKTARELRTVLERVVTEGTGTNARSTLYSTAGKTSTAYRPNLPENKLLGGEQSIAGFVGFAPLNQPRLTIYAAIIEPKGREVHGNRDAAPLFREVTERALRHLGVAPDRSPTE